MPFFSRQEPREAIRDYFQNYRFHLFDLTLPNTVSGLTPPVRALSPQVGFQEIDVPDFDVDTEQIEIGNDPLPHNVTTQAEVGSLTMRRGIQAGDDEFFKWIIQGAYARGGYRRDLGLVQIQGMLPGLDASLINKIGTVMGLAGAGIAAAATGSSIFRTPNAGNVKAQAGASAAEQAAGAATVSAAGGRDRDAFGVRAWVLQGCIPVNYTPADTLSAEDPEITVAELEVQPERMFEENIPSGPVLQAAAAT